MTYETTHSKTCHQLLQNVLMEAFQTETFLFTPPYKDLGKIDRGIRNIVWPDYYNSDPRFTPSIEDDSKRFFVIRSNLGFYNIMVYLTLDAQPDFISVGPFRSEGFSTTYFSQLLKNANVSSGAFQTLSQFYKNLPYVPLQTIVNVTKHIIDSFYPEFQNITPLEIEFTGQTHELKVNQDLLSDYSSDLAEVFQKKLSDFHDSVKNGNSDLAHTVLKEFLVQTKLLSTRNLSDCKKHLHTINSHLLLTLLETPVHPLHSLKLYSSLDNKIESIVGRDAAYSLPSDMCHKYCLLVRNYAFQEYSKTIRSVVNYIHLHLDEDLSLSVLADYFQKNATTLSSAFTKEVGMNVTNYIHQTRISKALHFFNTTQMSVSDVAVAVGFQDFAYFSRLFKKQIGCSPREYCKSIK